MEQYRKVSGYGFRAPRFARPRNDKLERLAVEERRDRGVLLQALDILRGRELRLVALGIDHAEEAERLLGRGAELVPCHRRHGDEIARLESLHLVPHETM